MMLDRLLEIVSVTAWVALALFVIIYVMVNARVDGIFNAIRRLLAPVFLFAVLLPVIAISLLSYSVVFIEPQNVGVVISLVSSDGYRDRPLRSGLYWIIPFAEYVYRYPIYWQTYTMASKPMEGQKKGDDSITARTSDGQEVTIDCSIIFQIDAEQAVRVHIDWQDRYVDDFLRPVSRGLIRSKVSQYTVDEVNSSKRLDLEKDLGAELRKTLADKGFIMDHFLLRNITFTDEYAASVEQKQIALQDAIKKEHEADQIRKLAAGQADKVTILAKAEAEAVRIKALAESEALKLIASALSTNPDLINYRYVDKLSPAIQVMLVPNNAPYILPLPTLHAGSNLTQMPSVTPSPTLMPFEQTPTPTLSPTLAPTPTLPQ